MIDELIIILTYTRPPLQNRLKHLKSWTFLFVRSFYKIDTFSLKVALFFKTHSWFQAKNFHVHKLKFCRLTIYKPASEVQQKS